ncbi:hypothetical protein QTN25_010255 [Entamoeba marina]
MTFSQWYNLTKRNTEQCLSEITNARPVKGQNDGEKLIPQSKYTPTQSMSFQRNTIPINTISNIQQMSSICNSNRCFSTVNKASIQAQQYFEQMKELLMNPNNKQLTPMNLSISPIHQFTQETKYTRIEEWMKTKNEEQIYPHIHFIFLMNKI